jgi:hypothetical protein
MFKPTYLYIKTHNVTGLKYFGKTVNENPSQYRGSGVRWLNHINYHGNDVSTELLGYFVTEDSCREAALAFSKEHHIVESSEWANLEEEDGLNGGFIGCIGEKNTQFGTRWITDETNNKKISKNDPIPDGWRAGRVVPVGWGDNIRQKLKGKKQVEIVGEDKALILAEKKRARMLGNSFAKR